MTIREGGMEPGAWLFWFVGVIVAKEITIPIPVCRRCPSARQRKGGLWGAVIGLVLLGLFAGLLGWFNPLALYLIPIFAVVGLVFGLILGRKIGYQVPLQIKRYSPKHGTLMIRFHRPAYEEIFLRSLRARSDATNPFRDE
jgi:hypothetical protein